jgi:curved DNA-binding protein CbpA
MERMKAINLAYETLSDPQKKATYDNDYWLYKQGGQPYNYHTTSRTKYRAKTIVKKKWNIVEVVIHYIVIFLLIKLFGLMFSSSQEEHTYHYRADDTPIINVIYPPDTKQQPIKNTYREWFVADSLKTDFFIRKQKGI